MRSSRSVFLTALTVLLACGGDSPVATGEFSPHSFVPVYTETQLVDGVTAAAPDPYTIESASVKNDTLRVAVRYGGGCRMHEFRLLLFKSFRESYPVQSDALLSHEANGDGCKSLLERELRFDLTPLRNHYRQTYLTRNGVIRLRLMAPGHGTVEYRF